MPVFHTKTIESILDPVAQQVSQLVILHEEAEDGNAMPDLLGPVQAVVAAVQNLAKVGRETADSSMDKVLKQDMPAALVRVEDASGLLVDASRMLKADPYSSPARKKLIDGARGILSGTSALLLAFDEAEVRKIIRICKSVLEYLAIAEVVETLEDLVTFVKNLTPGMTSMSKMIDQREKELTHQVHREKLISSMATIKNLTPVLISGIKIYATTKQTGGKSVAEAAENRNFLVSKLSHEINEVIRVLQLTTYDEEGWDVDDLTIMQKAQATIANNMDTAHDWLNNPTAMPGGLGEHSLRQIVDEARKIAERYEGPERREILRTCDEITEMANQLAKLRNDGMGNSPEAMQLAKDIQNRLNYLNTQVGEAVQHATKSGVRKPAPTVSGKVEQAQQWLAAPMIDDKGLGQMALRQVIEKGRRVAESCTGAERQQLERLCDECDQLTRQLTSLCARGKGNSPEALAVARKLSEKLQELKTRMQQALVNQVSDIFVDTTTHLKNLSKAANAPANAPNREAEFAQKAAAFEQHANQLANTAQRVAEAGGSTNKRTVEAIHSYSQQSKDLTPQVIHAGKILLENPESEAAREHFELLKKEWMGNMDKLTALVDEATNTLDFLKATEEGIARDSDMVDMAIKTRNPPQIIGGASNITRRAHRVIMVARQELENSEDPKFVQRVGNTSEQLEQVVHPMVASAKAVASNPADPGAQRNWYRDNKALRDTVTAVREAIGYQEKLPSPPPVEDFPPPPDFNQLHITEAPPRPPLPQDQAPPRPPPPEDTDDEGEVSFPQPAPNQPIMTAAYNLHMEAQKWSSKGNDIIAAAKKMALLMAEMSKLVRGEGGSKKDLISCAKAIAKASEDVTRLASEVANECTDKRMKMNLLQVCERIPTISTQLKILSTVKATMLGAQGSEEDQEATEMLVGNAQNLMQSVKETVRAAEAASIKIRTDAGYRLRWVRKDPWYK